MTKDPEYGNDLSFDGPLIIRSVSLSGIFFLMLMFTLYLAAPLLIPITLALFLGLVISPVMRLLVASKITQFMVAILMISLMTCLSVASIYAILGQAAGWLEKDPKGFRKLNMKIQLI